MGVWGPGSGRGVGRRPHKGLMRPKAQHRAPPSPPGAARGSRPPSPVRGGPSIFSAPPPRPQPLPSASDPPPPSPCGYLGPRPRAVRRRWA